MSVTGSAYKRALTADEIFNLVEWFLESYNDGWRPTITSHTSTKRGKLNAPWMWSLHKKLVDLDPESL